MGDKSVTVISLQPSEIWKYCLQNQRQLRENLVSIAENKSVGNEVFLTIEDDLTMVYVYCGDNLEYEEAIVSTEDATKVVRKIYEKYITSATSGEKDDEDEDEEPDRVALEDDMYERETELHDACYDFLNTILEYASECYLGEDIEDAIQETLDTVCRKFAKDFGISVRRPMYICVDGEPETYVEFPYDGILTGEEEWEEE